MDTTIPAIRTDVVAAPSPIVRVPGRHDLRAAILSLLPPMP